MRVMAEGVDRPYPRSKRSTKHNARACTAGSCWAMLHSLVLLRTALESKGECVTWRKGGVKGREKGEAGQQTCLAGRWPVFLFFFGRPDAAWMPGGFDSVQSVRQVGPMPSTPGSALRVSKDGTSGERILRRPWLVAHGPWAASTRSKSMTEREFGERDGGSGRVVPLLGVGGMRESTCVRAVGDRESP